MRLLLLLDKPPWVLEAALTLLEEHPPLKPVYLKQML
jgi:hypothetical protein